MIAEITMAVTAAKTAHAFITKAVGAGHDILDLSDRLGTFYDSRDTILAAEAENNSRSFFAKGSVESEALRIVTAKAQIAKFEADLREIIQWTQGPTFYTDMIQERRKIKDARVSAARRAAERKTLVINIVMILFASGVVFGAFTALTVAITGR